MNPPCGAALGRRKA
ncbi:IlvGEDA operon leader peptide [Cronobacter sakazakii]